MDNDGQQFRDKIIKWLTKHREENKGSKIEYVYSKALKSLKECEDSILTINDLLAVKHFGPKICQKIARELKYSLPDDFVCGDEVTESSSSSQETTKAVKSQKRAVKAINPSGSTGESPLRKKRTYCPKPNSGGYAILRALFEAEKEGQSSLAKNELMLSAQSYSHESMTKAKCGSHYTAWNSMATLIRNGLVVAEKHRFASYSLTDEGMSIIQKIRNYETRKLCTIDENSDSSSSPSEDSQTSNPITSSQSQGSSDKVIMFPNSFDIILIIDSREQQSGVANGYKKTALLSQLQQQGVLCEMKALPVGDFAWIARKKATLSSSCPTKDLIFDFVIERKRIDDLAKSIIDQRWKEQKFRLKQAGVRKPIYLIEEFSANSRKLYTVPFERMEASLVNSEIYDCIEFVYTANHSHTLSYLVTMSKALKRMYAGKTLYSCTKDEITNNSAAENHFMTFCEFERISTKITNFTVGEMFVKHLLQFKGISVAKAKTITEHYPTLSRLLDAYEICESDKDRSELLSSFVCRERKIGAVVSNKVFVGWHTLLDGIAASSVECD